MPSKFYLRHFIPGYYYHVFNRGANKQEIFFESHDYDTFLEIIKYYIRFPTGKPLSIISRLEETSSSNSSPSNKVPNLASTPVSSFHLSSFCLMPNHFHFLLKQVGSPLKTTSITNFMRRAIITYSMYMKDKYDRSGTLLQGKFKNVLIDTDNLLIYLSKYIHRNPLEILQGSEPLYGYPYSSYKYFIGKAACPDWLKIGEVLSHFSKRNIGLSYQRFIEKTPIDDKKLEGLLLE